MGEAKKICPLCGREPGSFHFNSCPRSRKATRARKGPKESGYVRFIPAETYAWFVNEERRAGR